ncbi:hypothetical protein V6N13_005911 [Hibiscus sabdariffa]|uniref:Uncharacterized protein n=1 Tax=Hibiscus sabdariffa TaxID=183260 RepID=A0ABR2ERV7_9ROSI
MYQADELKGNKHPILLLPFSCEICKNYSKLISCGVSSKYRPVIGIGTSMMLATLCCMIAASVETRRLNTVKSHSSLDKPDDNMSMFFTLLVPQFVLLGIIDGVFEQSVAGFFKNQVPPTMRPYLTWLSEGIRGAGVISGVASVSVVGKISQLGGKPSWFQDTLNRSRLDKYYWTLVVMAFVNLVFYIAVASRFKCRDSSEFESGREFPDFKETLEDIVCQDQDAGN